MKSNVWKTALTHFSQRYISTKTITDIKSYNMHKQLQNYLIDHTIICFDHLQIELSKAPQYPTMTQAIAKMIPSEE